MRKSKKEAEKTRETIVATAADYLRQMGIADSSVADVMAEAGLTHGGFYRHFENKEHLVADALAEAGEKTAALVARNIAKAGFNAAVDSYLSTAQRDTAKPNCSFAALGSEIARSGKDIRGAGTQVMERLFAVLESDTPEGAQSRRSAIVALSTMIGALTLARIATRRELSEEILASARESLHRNNRHE